MSRFFTRIDSSICSTGRPVEQIDPAKAAAALIALRGISAALAAAIATGALGRKIDAIATARRWGLLERIDTTEGRSKGLVQ